MRIAAAVSGGGHRATAWAIGALGALVETGLHSSVVSVSSVSGGSIANGVIASGGSFRRYDDPSAFSRHVGPVLEVAATDGLFFPGRATSRYVRGLLVWAAATLLAGFGLLAAAIAAGREGSLVGYAVAGAALGAALGWKLARPLRQPAWPGAAACAVLFALAGWGGAAATGGLHGGGPLIGLAIATVAWLVMCWLLVALLSRRGKAVERALATGLLAHPTEPRPLTLADVDSDVNHVICATDLESGDQFYLAPRFLYGFREGITTDAPARVTLAAAVQASAALPGAFPPVTIETGPFTRSAGVVEPAVAPERVVLADGGVYDNMAEQWEAGLARRRTVCPALTSVQEPAEVLVVANASAGWTWRPFGARSRIGRELLGLVRDQGVQYDISTARRRSQLFERFDRNRRDGTFPVGVIAMIDRSPVSLAAPFAEGTDDIGERARQALAFLRGQRTDDEWAAMARRNADVPTTLAPIGVEVTLDLLEHAHTSTVVGLHVLHGLGALVPFPRARYASLLSVAP